MAGECVRYRDGGRVSSGAIAAVSQGSRDGIWRGWWKWLEGGWESSIHSTYSFTDTYSTRAQMHLYARRFVCCDALPCCRGSSRYNAALLVVPTSPPGTTMKRAAFTTPLGRGASTKVQFDRDDHERLNWRCSRCAHAQVAPERSRKLRDTAHVSTC
jgi:hypothetical protein